MSSKKLRSFSTAVLGLIAMASSVSCGLRVGEPQSDVSALAKTVGSNSCLNGASNTLGDYFSGRATPEQIDALWSCAESSLKLFQARVKGSVPGVYSPIELKKFLEQFFLRDFIIPDGLMLEAMELKRTLLGGSVNSLTTEELKRLQQLMKELRAQSLAIQPYLPLTPSTAANLTSDQLAESITALQRASSALGELLQEHASPYSFENLDRLLYEIENFMTEGEYKNGVASMRKQLPLFRQLKRILVSPDDLQMAGTDWRVLLTTGADAYALYLRYSAITGKKEALWYGKGRDELQDISERSFTLLDQILDRNPDGVLSFADLDKLIDLIEPDLFVIGGNPICPQHVKNFLRPLVRRFLSSPASVGSTEGTLPSDPAPRPDPTACKRVDTSPEDAADGLRKEHLDKLHNLVRLWSDGQNFLEKTYLWVGALYGDSDPLSQSYIPMDLLRPSLPDVFHLPANTHFEEWMVDASTRLRGLFSTRPLFGPGESQIFFNGHISDTRHNFEGLSKTYAFRLLSHLALTAYAADPVRAVDENRGATPEEVRTFYFDLKELGIDLKLFDPTVLDASASRFMEANLFTYSANGDGYMSLSEATDLISFLLSAKGLSTKTHQFIANQAQKVDQASGCVGDHCMIGANDVFGKPTIQFDFYHQKFFEESYGKIWDHMPDLVKYYDTLPRRPAQRPSSESDRQKMYRETFSCLLEQVARTEGSGTKYFESSDTDQLAALSHYLEAFFVRFDVDGSGSFNLDEAKLAYPVLKKTLVDAVHSMGITSLSGDDDYFAVLAYLLKYGEIPSTADFIWWRYIRGTFGAWSFEADRGQVVRIMAILTKKDTSRCSQWPGEVPASGSASKPRDPNHRNDQPQSTR